MLVRNPKARLGNGPTGSAAIRKHPFFKNVDFNRLVMKLERAPFVPIVVSEVFHGTV